MRRREAERERNTRSEQLNTRGAYRVANQQSLACLSGSERRSPGWFLDMKYQTCFLSQHFKTCLVSGETTWISLIPRPPCTQLEKNSNVNWESLGHNLT